MSSENPAPLTVRRLDHADLPLYREIRLEGLKRAPHAFLATYEEEADRSDSWWRETLEKNVIVGAFCEDRLAGIGGLSVSENPKLAHKGLLWGTYVRPQYKHKKIGRDLVEARIKAAENTLRLVQVGVVSTNTYWIDTYGDLGFVPYGKDVLGMREGNHFHDVIWLVRFLQPSG